MKFAGQGVGVQKFLEYSAELGSALERLDEVIGLVFVGSTANISRVDEWSDHDFFIITRPGSAEAMRQDLSWLPRHDHVAIAPRETEHGLKVVYEDGQVLEFAVFNDSEFEVMSINSHSVVFDKTDITERIAVIAPTPKNSGFDANREFQLLLSQILIGVGRARRGELLSARQFISSFAMNHALGLIRYWIAPAPGRETDEDDLNRSRRFEFQYPEIGSALTALQQLGVEASARELLRVVTTLGHDHLSEIQQSQTKVILTRLGWEL